MKANHVSDACSQSYDGYLVYTDALFIVNVIYGLYREKCYVIVWPVQNHVYSAQTNGMHSFFLFMRVLKGF